MMRKVTFVFSFGVCFMMVIIGGINAQRLFNSMGVYAEAGIAKSLYYSKERMDIAKWEPAYGAGLYLDWNAGNCLSLGPYVKWNQVTMRVHHAWHFGEEYVVENWQNIAVGLRGELRANRFTDRLFCWWNIGLGRDIQSTEVYEFYDNGINILPYSPKEQRKDWRFQLGAGIGGRINVGNKWRLGLEIGLQLIREPGRIYDFHGFPTARLVFLKSKFKGNPLFSK